MAEVDDQPAGRETDHGRRTSPGLTISREEIAPQLTKLLNEDILREHNGNLIAADRFAGVSEKIVATLTEFHRQNPLLNGLEKPRYMGGCI
jgi:hypothetical protein